MTIYHMFSHEQEAFEDGAQARLDGKPYLSNQDYDIPETIEAYGRGWLYEDKMLLTGGSIF